MSVSIVCVCVYLCKHNNFTESVEQFVSETHKRTIILPNMVTRGYCTKEGRERERERVLLSHL